jgi:hypothetical protein
MNKAQFFLAAMRAEEFRRRAWVISAFSLIKEDPEAWKKEPYAYRIVQTPSGHFFVDPEIGNELTMISDAKAGEPIFSVVEHIALKTGEVPKLITAITTTYGRLLFNYTVVIYPFGMKIPYLNEQVTPNQMESIILERLKDDPVEGDVISPITRSMEGRDIYVSEYLKFCDAMFYLAGFTQLCVPAGTPKSMIPAPGIKQLREKLIAENAERLHDPAVIAKIDAELVAYDRAYLKDDLSMGFLIGKKSFDIVRKKQFGMHGAETGLSEGVEVELIQRSLSEGWDIAKFPAMNNSLRAGSYNRGAQTMLGGESVKWLLRASSNITVKADDCGSRLGNVVQIDGKNIDFLIGFHVVTTEGSVLVPDEETAKKYVGKTVMVRSPMYCQLEKTDFCKCCVGERLAANPTALSAAISEYGSAFLSIYMAAAHGKALQLAHMDFKTAIL